MDLPEVPKDITEAYPTVTAAIGWTLMAAEDFDFTEFVNEGVNPIGVVGILLEIVLEWLETFGSANAEKNKFVRQSIIPQMKDPAFLNYVAGRMGTG